MHVNDKKAYHEVRDTFHLIVRKTPVSCIKGHHVPRARVKNHVVLRHPDQSWGQTTGGVGELNEKQ